MIEIGQVDSRGFMRLRNVAEAIAYLASKGCGRVLRWDGQELHTAGNRGGRAWLVYGINHAEEREITEGVNRAFTFEPWSYRHHAVDMLKLYKRGWQATAAGQRVTFGWAGTALDAIGFRQQFIKALQQRISLKVSRPDYRKLENDYQIGLARDARSLNSQSAIRRLETPELRERFAHRLERACC